MHHASRLCLSTTIAMAVCLSATAAPAQISSTPNVASLSDAEAAIAAPADTGSMIASPLKRASFSGEPASREARQVADWVVASRDNRSLPFVIVDKRDAKVFVFDSEGHLRGAAPALLGLAHGDDSVPGIGDRPLSRIKPEERTTPAGRFVASLGNDLGEEDIFSGWIMPQPSHCTGS